MVLAFLQEAPFVETVQRQMLEMVEAYALTLDLNRITDTEGGLVGTFQQVCSQPAPSHLGCAPASIPFHSSRCGSDKHKARNVKSENRKSKIENQIQSQPYP
jgi:hypothetical protein